MTYMAIPSVLDQTDQLIRDIEVVPRREDNEACLARALAEHLRALRRAFQRIA